MDRKDFRYAFYSRSYADKRGCAIWEDENGKEVSLTRVSFSDRPDADASSPDEIFVGKVLKFVKMDSRALEVCAATRSSGCLHYRLRAERKIAGRISVIIRYGSPFCFWGRSER